MHVVHVRHSFLVALTFALAGCGGAGSPGSPSTALGSASFVHSGTPVASFFGHARVPRRSVKPNYATNASLVFEGDQSEAAVNVYQTADLSENPTPIASIAVHAGCPYGLAADKQGTLYVADNCSGNDVEEYPKGSTAESAAITDGISNPLGLAIDKKGTLYVSNYPGDITEYKHGTTTPSQTISGQGLEDPFGLALDKDDNLYICDFGADQVYEVKYGTTSVIETGLQDIEEPLGIAIDQKTGYIWVTDGAGDKIDVFKPGATTPFEQIAGNGNPYAISIENKGKPKGTVVESDIDTHAVYAFENGQYTSYATLTDGIELPTGLLITKP